LPFQNLVVEATGGGALAAPTYAISALSSDVLEGNDGVTGATFRITRSGDVSQAGRIDVTLGGDGRPFTYKFVNLLSGGFKGRSSSPLR
jgi:hypothetical protein